MRDNNQHRQLSFIGTGTQPGVVSWGRRGGYECSSKGDPRFSAFQATMDDGRTIEQHYQCDLKGYDPGGTNWRLGKGKPPLGGDRDLWPAYLRLWKDWAARHPGLIKELRAAAAEHGNRLSDCFASTPINQARALAEILNADLEERLEGPIAHDCPRAAAARNCGCGFCQCATPAPADTGLAELVFGRLQEAVGGRVGRKLQWHGFTTESEQVEAVRQALESAQASRRLREVEAVDEWTVEQWRVVLDFRPGLEARLRAVLGPPRAPMELVRRAQQKGERNA